MRLALKLVLVFMLANIALAGIYGYLAVRREVALFQRALPPRPKRWAPSSRSSARPRPGEDEGRSRACQESLRQGHCLSTTSPLAHSLGMVRYQAEAKFRPAVSAERLTSIVIQQHVAVETDEPGGTPNLHVYWPVTLLAQPSGGLEFTFSETELEANKREIIHRTALLDRRHAPDQRAVGRAARGSVWWAGRWNN